ncbi:MAG: helix-turn-helix domain-containing protein [Rhizobiaceae bacterium]
MEIADRTVDSVPEPLDGIAEIGNAAVDAGAIWERICDALEPHWLSTEDGLETQRRAGTQRVAAWARSLAARAAVSGPGMSVRAFERRLRRWTGQNRQSLAFYSSIEDLHQLSVRSGTEHLAAIAHDAGFSDQSHMGRALRRATGFSPARLNRLIATEEAFWCYRLLGERF